MIHGDKSNHFGYEFKKRDVLEGKSKILKNWQEHSTVTTEEFLDALRWVCDDPCDGGTPGCFLTREIGLTPNGIKKLKRVYYGSDFAGFYECDAKMLWGGEPFEQECPKFFDKTGKTLVTHKISLSAKNTI